MNAAFSIPAPASPSAARRTFGQRLDATSQPAAETGPFDPPEATRDERSREADLSEGSGALRPWQPGSGRVPCLNPTPVRAVVLSTLDSRVSTLASGPRPAALVPFRCDPATELDAWLETLTPGQRSHARHQELHFMHRLHQRYGLRISPKRYRYWIRKVEEVLPGTRFVRPGTCPERTLWEIRSGSYTLHVCYDEITRRLVTCFMPAFAPLPAKRRHRQRARRSPFQADSAAKARHLAAA